MSTERTKNGAVRLGYDAGKGIATLTLEMEGSANKINDAFGEGFAEALSWALAQEGLKGIIVASAHRDWCVGADIDMLFKLRDPEAIYNKVRALQDGFRKLEMCGVPVVAAITGSALGGGCELALSCHRRIVVEDPKIQIGLPEVTLGVLPGGGGTQRLPRMLGIQKALEIIAQGKMIRAPKAKAAGLVDDLQPDADAVRKAAEAWIASGPSAKQPWDERGFRFPAPRPGSADARDLLTAAAAMVFKKTAGAFTAPEYAMCSVHEGSMLTLDRAMEVEARYFVKLAASDEAKDMMRTIWYHRTAAEKHKDLPALGEGQEQGIETIAILGAGMMGAALGWVCANAGYKVVLKDIKQEQLDVATKHCEKLTQKRAKHLDDAGRKELMGRIVPTLELEDLKGTDLVIEAVFEDIDLKHRVTKEIEPLLSERGIWASNTSALPITDLAQASAHPDRFIGMHFFSPVEQMPLLEIIEGKETSKETVARSLAFCRQIKKLPIVVNDGYGFYTTRVFSTYLMEAVQLVAEGHDPDLVEWAARTAGMVIGPLQVFDEVTLTLVRHALEKGKKYVGDREDFTEGFELLRTMVDQHERHGRAAGAGFYAYNDKGRRQGIWPGLAELVSARPETTGVDVVGERILLSQAVEAARAMEDGVLQRNRDAEVGAIFGIGFAPNTGGPLSYFDRLGLKTAVSKLRELATAHGARFTPPKLLVEMAEKGETFFEPV